MKFLQAMGRAGYTSYHDFEFEEHCANDVCVGDSIWSDGHCVQVAEFVDKDDLMELISMVSNKTAFKGALRRCGISWE